MKKIIVALEGIDGAGKSSVIRLICDRFQDNVIVYRRTEKGKFIDKVVSCKLMKRHYLLQIPIYIFLSHLNMIKYILKSKNEKIVIMDRCFLSNVCYFFPKSLKSKRKSDLMMLFEPKLIPQKIFILDVNPAVAESRDLYKKNLQWLIHTREAYLDAKFAEHLGKYNIEVIDEKVSMEMKAHMIINYIHGVMKNGY